MSYATTISGIDMTGAVRDVRVVAGYTWATAGIPEQRQDEITLDIPFVDLTSPTPVPFTYPVDLAPGMPRAWFVALWIQEISRTATDGWLFRSGRFLTEPPAEPIEIIVAPEILVGTAELTTAVGVLPMTSGSTTITGLTLTISGADVLATAVGTDTRLPAGVTFTFTGLVALSPNDSLQHPEEPFLVVLGSPSISFNASPGTGFVTAILNLVSGIITGDAAPGVRKSVSDAVNKGALTAVATRLGLGMPSTMPSLPPGMVLSIRKLRATTRTTAAGTTEPVIGILAALGAFGGVLNKFPALPLSPVPPVGGGSCVIATAATSPQAPEVMILKAWRDRWLRQRRGGAHLIKAYERHSPVLARFIARSDRRRALTRLLIVAPAVQLARWLLKRAGIEDG